MSFLSRDTSPEAAAKQLEVLRNMEPGERLKIVFELNVRTRRFMEAGVRHRNPVWDDEQVRLEVIRLWLGDELFKEAFGREGSS